jgi:enediyne biosynthesis protein E4
MAWGCFYYAGGAESMARLHCATIVSQCDNYRTVRRRLRLACLAAPFAALAAPAAQPPAIALRDVAPASGIDFRLNNHPTPAKRLIETMPGGLAAFDYDNDGLIDLYFTNGAGGAGLTKQGPADWNRLYRNNGDFTFTDVTERAGVAGHGYAMGVAAADYDNDGHADLFVAGVERNVLYRNTGRGTFEDVTARAGIAAPAWAVAAAWLDYDRDGRLDLFVVHYLKWSAADDRYCGARERDIRVYCHPKYYEGLANALYRNKGDGTFEDVSVPSGIAGHVGKGMSAAVADYDADGWLDVFVTNDTVPNFLFRNRGDGRFEEVGLLAGVALTINGRAISSMGAEFHDYDNDGRPDIHVTALAGETFPLFHNDGGGQFSDRTGPSGLARATARRSGWGNALADLDNDGWKDLFTANSHVNDRVDAFEAHAYREPNSLFRNVGDGTFTDISGALGDEWATPRAHRGGIAVDLNNDGRLDLVTTSLGDRVEIWENRTANGHRWLALTLLGAKSGRDAVGARVRVGRQLHTVTTAAGYASSVRAPVHVGLGAATRVEQVEITWPGGATQVLRDVESNTRLVVRE